ncbi:MAG TPA: hypothetical protein VGV92_00820 [Gammaproteobacteria bacterium]|nr:hypothetical protein [Gammaproteobacteria bacterium]
MKFEGEFKPNEKVAVCVSLKQPYGNAPIFPFIFREMFRVFKETGTFFYLILPDTLEGYNLQAIYNQPSASTPIIQGITQQANEDWKIMNLYSDLAICEMREEMEKAGKLRILGWEEAKKEFAAELESASKDLAKRAQTGDISYYEQTAKLAKIFFDRAYAKEYGTNASFQATCQKGEAYVTQIYWNHGDEECRMIGALIKAGITKLLYPDDYYKRLYGKGPNANDALFSLITPIFCNPQDPSGIKMVNIQITPRVPGFVSKQERRRNSTDAAIAEKQAYIDNLKEQKRLVQQKLQQSTTKVEQLQRRLAETEEKVRANPKAAEQLQLFKELFEELDAAHRRIKQLDEELARKDAELDAFTEDKDMAYETIKQYYTERQMIEKEKAALQAQRAALDKATAALEQRELELEQRIEIRAAKGVRTNSAPPSSAFWSSSSNSPFNLATIAQTTLTPTSPEKTGNTY